ncbi:MAG: DUF5686 and carboxypeptidase regulatory-like domain-containing protein [Bacteroidales bacterium]|nr:DUF5686 and carboxypeptidase regulatory-like domain-containing protein [Bacteroidales bacterium]
MRNSYRSILFIFYILSSVLYIPLSAQNESSKNIVVKGIVTEENEDILPFVNIYIKGTTKGTTSNIEGRFTLNIRNDRENELVFQYVGYKKYIVKIPAGNNPSPLNVILSPEQILLKEAVITANREDPAYPIIRNAIAMRKHFLREVQSYSTKMYMKSNVTLDEIPEKFFLISKKEMPDSSDLGLLYLSESVSIYNFQKPNSQKEEMIASKVAGTKAGYSFNRADIVLLNFYNNLIFIGFSERGFISPIAYNALFYYRYRLIDSFQENELLIHKIQVIPKRKSDNVFLGYIYIVDRKWNIHSINLKITRDSQVELIDSIRIRQIYIPAHDSIWTPLSLHFIGYFKVFGFRASTNFIAFFTEYDVNREFPKGFFSNEVFKVTEESTKRDSVYWESKRQTVLTEEEMTNYKEGDSLLILHESKEYQDSVNKENNVFKPLQLFMDGYSYNNWFKKYSYGINSIVDGLASFNTVEGLSINIKPWYRKTFENKQRLNVSSSLKYSFTSQDFNYYMAARYRFDNFKYQYISLSGGKYVVQYCRPDPISDFFNSIYTLLLKENYAKYYSKKYVKATYGREIINGLNFSFTTEYSQREALVNNTDYSLIKYPDKEFLSNNPLDISDDTPAFETNNALIFNFGFVIKFKQKYAIYPKRKVVYGSKYPIIRLKYRKAAMVFGCDVKFDQWEVEVSDNISFKQLGTSSISVSTGGFFNKKNMYFLDFKHFNGNQTIFMSQRNSSISIGSGGSEFNSSGNNNFQTLDYYNHSTNNTYFQTHYEHHFNGWIINKFPLIRKTKMQVVGGVNFLYTSDKKEYTELFAGIEHILKVLRIDFVTKYSKYSGIKPQVRIGMGF